MSRRVYECQTCGEAHASVVRAALCCDVVSNDLDDDNPDIIRSSD